MEFLEGLFGLAGLVIIVLIPISFILIMRLLGAWMLRINDVIHYQKEILNELKTLNSKKE